MGNEKALAVQQRVDRIYSESYDVRKTTRESKRGGENFPVCAMVVALGPIEKLKSQMEPKKLNTLERTREVVK